jgi:RimJ/RimL family protein N-acetyltransferase
MALDADPAVRAFIGGPPDPEAHRAEVARNIALGRPEPHASWAVEWRGTPGLLGLCSLSPWEETGLMQISWRLHRAVWGRGVATEAAGTVLARALGPLGLRAVVALIHPDNAASIRVAEKIGMAWCGGARYRGIAPSRARGLISAADRPPDPWNAALPTLSAPLLPRAQFPLTDRQGRGAAKQARRGLGQPEQSQRLELDGAVQPDDADLRRRPRRRAGPSCVGSAAEVSSERGSGSAARSRTRRP